MSFFFGVVRADFEGDATAAGGAAAADAAASGGAVVVVGGKKKSGAPAWVDEDDAALKVTHSLRFSCTRHRYYFVFVFFFFFWYICTILYVRVVLCHVD